MHRWNKYLFLKCGFCVSLFINFVIFLKVTNYEEVFFKGNDHMQEYQKAMRGPTCQKCFQHKYKYIIENKKLCNTTEMDLLILIFSEGSHAMQRGLIRETWATLIKDHNFTVKYSFLLGKSQTKKGRRALQTESKKYQDIIQENFDDNFNNLTLKTVMAFKWANSHCSHAKYLMKVDDDVFVNVKAILYSFLSTYGTHLKTAVAGKCWEHSKPIRNKKSKYFVSLFLYNGDEYPPFCSGTAYITSMTVVKAVFKTSKNIPFFPLEDVYVGMCLRKLHFKVLDIPGFNIDHMIINPCDYFTKYIFTSHGNTFSEVQNFWNMHCEENNFLFNHLYVGKSERKSLKIQSQ